MYSLAGFVVLLSVFTVTVYCDCGKTAWGEFKKCVEAKKQELQTTAKNTETANCFKTYCQPSQTPDSNGRQTSNMDSYESFGQEANDVNKTLLKECGSKIMAQGKADLEKCVQTTESTFALPSFDIFEGEQWKNHGHEAVGIPQPSMSGNNGPSVPLGAGCNQTALRTCLSGLLGDKAKAKPEDHEKERCDTTKVCLKTAFKGCNESKIHDSVCSCANNTLRQKFDQYASEMKLCLGPKNDQIVDKIAGAKQKDKVITQIVGMFCKAWNADDICKPPQFQPDGSTTSGTGGRNMRVPIVRQGAAAPRTRPQISNNGRS